MTTITTCSPKRKKQTSEKNRLCIVSYVYRKKTNETNFVRTDMREAKKKGRIRKKDDNTFFARRRSHTGSNIR